MNEKFRDLEKKYGVPSGVEEKRLVQAKLRELSRVATKYAAKYINPNDPVFKFPQPPSGAFDNTMDDYWLREWCQFYLQHPHYLHSKEDGYVPWHFVFRLMERFLERTPPRRPGSTRIANSVELYKWYYPDARTRDIEERVAAQY